MKFDAFYNYERLTQFLQEQAERAPDLVRVESLATTAEGRELWCVEVAARSGQAPLACRPALLATGNLHAIEYAGSMACLHLLETLVAGYGESDEIRRLLEERVFYIVPRIAVDGAEYGLTTLDRVRSRRIPLRERGAVDPQDINGDGRILTMRWQSDSGAYVASQEDPRLLVPRRPEDAGPFYHIATEGLIHEWDGGPIRAPGGRIDFNRNFPAHWVPLPGSIGHGRYPLSEVETRALADFVLARPHIVTALDFHTGNPAIFYPSGVVAETARHPEDVRTFARLGRIGEALTGFPYLSGYLEAKTGKKTERLPGSFLEWMYEHVGSVAFVVEMGLFYNYLGVKFGAWFDAPRERELIPGIPLLAWHDAHPEHQLFFEWEPFDHPQLGRVEIGGWNWVLWSNPPLFEMESVCERCTRFALRAAAYAPRVRVDVEAMNVADGVFKVTAQIENVGEVSTSVTAQGARMHPDSKPRVKMSAPAPVEYIVGRQETTIEHVPPQGARRLEWVIRTPSRCVDVEVRSTRGVFARRQVALSAPV